MGGCDLFTCQVVIWSVLDNLRVKSCNDNYARKYHQFRTSQYYPTLLLKIFHYLYSHNSNTTEVHRILVVHQDLKSHLQKNSVLANE
jgi:hypothetical protein